MGIIKSVTKGLYTHTLHDNGIMYAHISDENLETVETQLEAIQTQGEMQDFKMAPTLHTFSDFAMPNQDVRANYAKFETNPYSKADAFIVDSLAHKLLADFYINFNKPVRPTKVFRTEAEAVEWLKQFV